MKFKDNKSTGITCPECEYDSELIVRTNRTTDHQFLGCPTWPECEYTRGIPEEWIMRAQGQIGLFDLIR